MKFAKLSSSCRKRLARLPQERFSRRDPYPGYPLKPSDAARDPASGASGSGAEASPHPLRPAPYTTRCRNRFDLLLFLASPHGEKKNRKEVRHRGSAGRNPCTRCTGISLHLRPSTHRTTLAGYSNPWSQDETLFSRHLCLDYQGSYSTRK